MEIEQENTSNINCPKSNSMEVDMNINNYYYNNENNAINYLKNFYFLNKGKYTKKRNYNDSLSSTEKILIKEKEIKYLYKLLNQIRFKIDSSDNFITKIKLCDTQDADNKDTSEIKSDNNININYKIDYSMIDLNYVLIQLYQSNNLSDELKKFVLKKLVDNAIKVERTFQNFFNVNNMPNKK